MRLIDANALKKAIADAFYNLHEIAYITDIIERQPTIEAEPVRRGRWIETRHTPIGDTMYCDCNCSICNFEIVREKGQYPRFCENCGARMGADHIADDSKKVGGADNA